MLLKFLLAAAGTGFTFLMTVCGSAAVFFMRSRKQRSQGLLLGFAAGVMTAATVWSLLLPALAYPCTFPCWCSVSVGVILGAGFLFAMDFVMPHTSFLHLPKDSCLLLSAITLHNIPEGIAVGMAFALADKSGSFLGAAALAIGIGIQNFPEGAAVSLPLYQQGVRKSKAFTIGMLSGAVEPLFGIPIVLIAAAFQPLMPWILGFAAGAMLYVTVDELIPQADGKVGTLGFLCGFLVMMILDVALG